MVSRHPARVGHRSVRVLGSRIKPAVAEPQRVAVAAVQVVTVTGVTVRYTDMIAEVLYPSDGVVHVRNHVLWNRQSRTESCPVE